MVSEYDAVVIGGGFFGATMAAELAARLRRVLLVERESDLLQRASYVNQARVHQGYHYPRSVLTAFRSRVNFDRFVEQYGSAVDSSFTQIYAIGRIGSRVSADQFQRFCARIGAPIAPAPKAFAKLLSRELIEAAFEVREYAFDSSRLKTLARSRLIAAGVECRTGVEALRVEPEGPSDRLCTTLRRVADEELEKVRARFVFVCAYSRINRFLEASGLPRIPFKHEIAEIALIDPPEPFRGYGLTVMDGPFFGTMPFPARKLHSFYHVRYAPHYAWHEGPQPGQYPAADSLAEIDRQVNQRERTSRYGHMIRDAQRYVPCLAEARWVESLWEIRTVLPQSEGDDSRPILYRKHHGLPNLFCVAGGKIDNVFDLVDELRATELE